MHDLKGYTFGPVSVVVVAFTVRTLVRLQGKLLPDQSALSLLDASFPGDRPLRVRQSPDLRIARIHQGPMGLRFEVVSSSNTETTATPPPLAENIDAGEATKFRQLGARLGFVWEAPIESCQNYRALELEDFNEMMRHHELQRHQLVRETRMRELEEILEREHRAFQEAEKSRALQAQLEAQHLMIAKRLEAARRETARNLELAAMARTERMSARARRRTELLSSVRARKAPALPAWLMAWSNPKAEVAPIASTPAPDVSVLATNPVKSTAPAAPRRQLRSLSELVLA